MWPRSQATKAHLDVAHELRELAPVVPHVPEDVQEQQDAAEEPADKDADAVGEVELRAALAGAVQVPPEADEGRRALGGEQQEAVEVAGAARHGGYEGREAAEVVREHRRAEGGLRHDCLLYTSPSPRD